MLVWTMAAILTPVVSQIQLPAFGGDLPSLLLGSVITSLGLAAIAAYAFRRRRSERILLWLGLFAGPYGLELITRNPVFRLSYGQPPRWWQFAESLIEFASVIPGMLLFQDLYGRGWRSIIAWLTRGYTVFAVIGFGFTVYLNRPDVFPAPGIGMIVLLPAALLLGRAMGYHPPRLPYRSVLFGGLAFYFLTFTHDRLINGKTLAWHAGIEPYGLFVLVCSLGYVAIQRVVADEKQLFALSEEMRAATEIQTSILPRIIPKTKTRDIAVRYAPMTAVAGDFYDFIAMESGCLGILVADVAGHGVPAALVASMIKVAASMQRPRGADPSSILAGLNSMLCQQAQGNYASAVYLYLDEQQNLLRYSSAGHPPPLLWRNRTRELLKLDQGGLLLGVRPGEGYIHYDFRIEMGDRLLVYSDGVIEATNSAEQPFGDFRFAQLIKATSDLSVEQFSDRLLDEVRSWPGPQNQPAQSDDITFLVIDIGE